MQGYDVLDPLSKHSIQPSADASRSINNLAARLRYLLKGFGAFGDCFGRVGVHSGAFLKGGKAHRVATAGLISS